MTSRNLSKVSTTRLSTCHPALRNLVAEVVKLGPFSNLLVVEGIRTIETQRLYVAKGVSKTMDSKHLAQPPTGLSHAVDLAILLPDGSVNWGKTKSEVAAYYVLAGSVYTIAKQMQAPLIIRWGGNWDSDEDYGDQTFQDLVHFEMV